MSLPQTLAYFSPEDYLNFEESCTERHEYLDGLVYAMAGESPVHSTINTNLTSSFVVQLRGTSCRVMSPNMKVRTSESGLFAYPDATVVCGDLRFHDARQNVLTNPTLIAEILSPSTAKYDRNQKFVMYQNIDTLEHYLLVSQDVPRIEHYARSANGAWESAQAAEGLSANLEIKSRRWSLRLAEVYDRIEFE